MTRLTPIGLCVALGCSAAGPAPGGDDEIRTLLDIVRSGGPGRQKAALEMIREKGPAGTARLRLLLLRREGPPDPVIAGLVGQLDDDDSDRRTASVRRLTALGRAAEPDLWETVFTSGALEPVLLSIEILEKLYGTRMLVELMTTIATTSSAPERLEPLREPDRGRRFGRLKDDATLWQVANEEFPGAEWFWPVEKDE